MSFEYDSLPTDAESIRLLELLPAEDNTVDVSCHLMTVALSPLVPYTALSYRWEHSPGPREVILINGKPKEIGKNLASALRHIRADLSRTSSPLSPLIWADAVCINQKDEEEKSSQVQLMGAIYSHASTVVSWLGVDEAGKMTAAVTAINDIQQVAMSVPNWLEDLHWMQDHPSLLRVVKGPDTPNTVWNSLKIFFSEPYWLRVWVLHEMVLARNLWVMVGDRLFDYQSVSNFAKLLRNFHPESRLGEEVLPYEILYLLRSPEWIPTVSHTVVHNFYRNWHAPEEVSDAEKLEAILSTWTYQATDPRDKVFALQGLLQNFVSPDYTKSVVEVFSTFMSKYIANLADLYVIRFSGAAICPPEIGVPGLSSWVPDLQAISLQNSWQAFPAQVSCADHGMDTLLPFQAQVIDGKYLRVNALLSGEILDTEPIVNSETNNLGRIYRKLLAEKSHIESRTNVPYLQAILRAILSDEFLQTASSRDIAISALAQRQFLATLYFIEGLTSNAPIPTTLRSTAESLGIASGNHLPTLLQTVFPDEAMHECWNYERAVVLGTLNQAHLLKPHLTRSMEERHHLFHTSSGYIGCSRDGVQAGDVIGVIQGCPSPVLLRRKGTRYVHLGTCLVLGLMNGEAATRVASGSLEIAEIEIA